jgi:hypothetical protein
MAKLNLNYCEDKGRRVPTEDEINQIASLAFSVEALTKALSMYCNENSNRNVEGYVCVGVCEAIELLMGPIITYLCNYAGELPGEAEVTA